MSQKLVTATLTALTVAGIACGSSEEDEVRDVVVTYLVTFTEGNTYAACTQLTPEGEAKIREVGMAHDPTLSESTPCGQFVQLILAEEEGTVPVSSEDREALEDSVDVEQVEGTKAEGEVSDGDETVPFYAEKINGEWLLATPPVWSG